jgi:hypothetical protein
MQLDMLEGPPQLADATVDPSRLQRLQRLAARLSRRRPCDSDHAAAWSSERGDREEGEEAVTAAIVLASGWDSCWHAECAALLDWLCGGAAPRNAFAVITADAAAVLSPQVQSYSGSAAAAAGDGVGSEQQQQQQQEQEQQHAPLGNGVHPAAPAQSDTAAALAADAKVSTFARLLSDWGVRRVAVPLGWEVAGGSLRRAGSGAALARWPLMRALATAEGRPLHARFEVRLAAFRSACLQQSVAWSGRVRCCLFSAPHLSTTFLPFPPRPLSLETIAPSHPAGRPRHHPGGPPAHGRRRRPRRARAALRPRPRAAARVARGAPGHLEKVPRGAGGGADRGAAAGTAAGARAGVARGEQGRHALELRGARSGCMMLVWCLACACMLPCMRLHALAWARMRPHAACSY